MIEGIIKSKEFLTGTSRYKKAFELLPLRIESFLKPGFQIM